MPSGCGRSAAAPWSGRRWRRWGRRSRLTGLDLAALSATLDSPFLDLLGADFVRASAVAVAATLLLLGLALGPASPGAARRWGLLAAALALLLGATAGSHAVARTDGRAMLLAATGLHQLGAAFWIGGLPALLASLRLHARPPPGWSASATPTSPPPASG